MICPKCSYTLTLLFTSTACDRCDGLLKPEVSDTQEYDPRMFHVGLSVCHESEPEIVGVIDAIDFVREFAWIDWTGSVYEKYGKTRQTLRTLRIA